LYFYLTTTPHQPIPAVAEPIPKASRIISPSLSSASDRDEEERFTRERQSLSPEVDLSSPELDEDTGVTPCAPGGSFATRNSMSRERATFTHPRRNASPPLETEERDFKQTASALYEEALKRRNSHQDVNMDAKDASPGADDSISVSMSIEPDESEESVAFKNSQAAVVLFGTSLPSTMATEFSSPVLQPQRDYDVFGGLDEPTKFNLSGKEDYHVDLPDPMFALESLQSPENIDLCELEDMFDAY
jgi:hypothetical protein